MGADTDPPEGKPGEDEPEAQGDEAAEAILGLARRWLSKARIQPYLDDCDVEL